MKTKAAVSPRERLAASFVFMAATVDENGIVGGRPSSWVGRAAGRAKVKPRKKIRYVQKAGVHIKKVFSEKPPDVLNHMRHLLTSRVPKRSKLIANVLHVSLVNPLRLTRTKTLASGVKFLHIQAHTYTVVLFQALTKSLYMQKNEI